MYFDAHTAFPKDFNDNFLQNGKNKECLNAFLISIFMTLHNTSEKVLIITKDDKIVSKNISLDVTEIINFCSAEEADPKLVRHDSLC